MPNNITTAVEIMGPKDKLSKLIKETKIKLEEGVENEFDFNGIIPMPPELEIKSGSQTDLGMAALGGEKFKFYTSMPWFADRYPGVETPEQLKDFLEKGSDSDKEALKLGRQALENKKKHGYKDWYDWSSAKWGTKWNAYDVKYLGHDDNHLLLEITTAWDTPRQIWDKLEEMGFDVNGTVYGEMEGTETIGDGGPFYIETVVEFNGDLSPYKGEK